MGFAWNFLPFLGLKFWQGIAFFEKLEYSIAKWSKME